MTTTPYPVVRPPSMSGDGQFRRPHVPHTVHLKEWPMVDGRKILIDRRAVAFVCQRKEEPEKHSIVAFRSGASGIPIAATYADLVKWWRTTP